MTNAIHEGRLAVYPQAEAQQTLQQQQIAAQMGMQGMQMYNDLQQNQAMLVQQTNPNKIIDDMLLQLKGQRKKEDGSIETMSKPILNEYGLQRAWFYASAIVNQGTVLSHLEEGEAGNITVNYGKALVDELTLDWKQWGIVEKSWLDSVADTILIRCFLALRRAEGQNEKNWLGKITFENLNNAPRIQQPKKESWLSKFKL